MLSYRGLVLTPGGSCAQVLTEYGPKFNFGALAPGEYTVTDSMTGNTVTTFTVAPPQNSFRVSGVVTDDNGVIDAQKAVAKCKVYIRSNNFPVLYDSCPMCVYNTAKLAKASTVIGMPIPLLDSTVTDASGRYQFLSVNQGSYTLEFVAAGYQGRTATVSVPPDTVMNVSLLPINAFASIKGTVKEGCLPILTKLEPVCFYTPLAGCTVSVTPSPIVYPVIWRAATDTLFQSLPLYRTYRAVTDANGRYSIDSIPVTYDTRQSTVSVRKTGYEPDARPISLYPGSATIADFMLLKQVNSASKTVDGITFTLATDKRYYQAGDLTIVTYTVKNNSMATVTFNSGGCGNFDITAVNRAGDTIYNFPGGIMCIAVTPPIVLASGDSTTREFRLVFLDSLNPITITEKIIGYDKTAVSLAVDVSPANTPVQPPRKPLSGGMRPAVSYSSQTKTLYVTIDKPQNVSIEAFGVDGKKIPQLSQARFLESGTHAIAVSKADCSAGIVIFRVQGEKFSSVKRINLAAGR
jgi:hypothetical protein